MVAMALAAGAMALGGLVQLYNAEKTRGAEKKRLKEIEKLYNDIKPPDYDLRIIDPPQLHEEMLATPEFSGPQAAPKFNLSKLSQEQYKQVGKFIPEVAPYIAEEAPQTIEKTADMKAGRQAQMNALRRLQEIGAGEFDPEYQEAVTKASRQSQADAQSRQASILQDFARRGQSGSGLNLAAQIGGASQAMDREAMTNLGAATQSYRNRLNALSQGADLGSRIGQEDQNFQSRNADIINSFNQRMSSAQQNYQNQRAQQMNAANQYNLGVEQNLSNLNTQGANDAARSDRQRLDELTKYGAGFATNERNRMDDLAKWGYGQDVNNQRYQNDLALGKYDRAVSERNYGNTIKGQQYQNALGQAGGKAGVTQQFNNSERQAAQDRNSALGGLTNIGMQYAQNQEARNAQGAKNTATADQSFYEKQGRFMNDDELDDYRKRQDSYNDYY